MSRIIFIFIFIEYGFWELYSYSNLSIRNTICYTLVVTAMTAKYITNRYVYNNLGTPFFLHPFIHTRR